MLEVISAYFNKLFFEAISIWISGGWSMVAIACISMILFSLGMSINFRLHSKGFLVVPEKKWKHWINHPEKRKGAIGELLDFVTGGNSIKDTRAFFEELYATEITPFERDLKVMKICVAAAPLLGLLGTVTGMLSTFGALSSGSGGEKTMQMVAAGISEALVTTETGLIIALPGLFCQYALARGCERYKAFLAHLETVCTQKQYKKLKLAIKD